MSGAKQKSGGSRPGNPNRKRGGSRPGSGPTKRNLHISRIAALELRILLRNRQAIGIDIDETLLVEQFIHEKWLDYDRSIQEAVATLERFEDDEVIVL